jgi:hypothetical protein
MPEIFTNESNFVCRATKTCLDGLRRSLVSMYILLHSMRICVYVLLRIETLTDIFNT